MRILVPGYAPQVDFATGLADTVRWYRETRAWWQPLRADAPAMR
jgi:dTDP-glucose 4,6-dehydratase